MAERISIGIDVGTSSVKVLVAESNEENRIKPKILGAGYSESKGFHRGYIIDLPEATRSIKQAISAAEKSSGYKISKAYLSVGGMGLGSAVFGSSMTLSSKDTEIGEGEIKKLLENAESELPESFTLNKIILHAIALQYKIDGKAVLGKPQGMRGGKIDVKVLYITSLSQHLDDLIDAVEACDIEIEDVMASPLAASLIVLNKTQQMAGCALINVGAETVSLSVFENGAPVSLEVLPIGSVDITNDIALGLKLPLEEAERVKLSKPESVPYPRKKLEEIIGARLGDIFELVESHLKKIGRSGLLPAGAIITGGGSSALNIEDLAKNYLKLPSKKAVIKFEGEIKLPGNTKENSWSVAYGLCILGGSGSDSNSPVNRLGMRFVSKARSNIWAWIKKILP